MKLIIICFLLIGCATKYAQIIETDSPQTIPEKGYQVFQNDTVKIVYNFWQEGGTMSFMLINQLDVPLYIDWKKCSYITNGKKLNYYEDKVTRNRVSITASKFYSSFPRYEPFALSLGVSKETETRNERVMFIPPHSYIVQTFYDLTYGGFVVNQAGKETRYRGDTAFTVYTQHYDKDNSPFQFRNFITYSTSESFAKEGYVDNQFYAARVISLEENDFIIQASELKAPSRLYYISPSAFYNVELKSTDIGLSK